LAEAHPTGLTRWRKGFLSIDLLQRCLIEITGMDAITLQPAAGAHGEFTGILLVRACTSRRATRARRYLFLTQRMVPIRLPRLSAAIRWKTLKSNAEGGIDLEALTRQVDEETAALMLTNPSTIGVFESQIAKIAEILSRQGCAALYGRRQHERAGGQGGPGDFGVDVMHLNLHKTFSTPHGGGGPGPASGLQGVSEPFCPRPF